jgi:two-component system response regulator FixJ
MSSTHRRRGNDSPVTPDAVVHVIDDDEATRNVLQLLLKTVGLKCATYSLFSVFVEEFDVDQPGCVVLDVRMPESNGIETMSWLQTLGRAVPVIFATGYGDLATAVRAMKLGAVDFFEKPFNKELLIETIQHWVRNDLAAHQPTQGYVGAACNIVGPGETGA